jgi:undecaprenol kinase/diacylglycerol kinase (ATP)
MNRPPENYFMRTIKSFGYALSGIVNFFRVPSNGWIHLVMAILACAAGYYLGINRNEWFAIIFAIALVIVSEMMNTAIEMLTDLVSPDYNELAGRVKDAAAGAVLVASIAAAVIGVLVFLPKLI